MGKDKTRFTIGILKKEGVILNSQEKAIQTNATKARIDKL